MPKLHKNSYGHRFIAASASCTTKPLSKLLTHCLQLILKHYKEYCKGIERRTGVNCFWVINNSTEVTNTLDKLRHARALDSFDFSTLYTNIPHSQLKTRMEELIRNAYNTRDASHMALGKDYAYWTSRPVANTRNLTVNQLVEMFNFLIDNVYTQVGSAVYQQTIGIPMGTDCAPLVADLFLFSYEFEFMKSLIRTDLPVAAKFSNTCRYIDDLLTLNNPDFQACTSHKKVFRMKTSTCRDEMLKNQPNKMGMTPQHIHTIPTSCAILPTICFVFVSLLGGLRKVVGRVLLCVVVHVDVHGSVLCCGWLQCSCY